MLLSDLRRGDRFRIVKVIIGEAIGKRLVDMGLNRGVEGVLVRCAMLGDPVQIRIRHYNLSLRLTEAAGVEIELLEQGRHGHGRRGERSGAGPRGPLFGHGPGRGHGRRQQGPGPGRDDESRGKRWGRGRRRPGETP
jgi:ferrous iron transport protein A